MNRSPLQIALLLYMFITENKIAFTAGLQSGGKYSSQQILKFIKVITNVGGGLNASDGVFYCPEPGLYYFFVNVMSNANDAYIEIHKNDKLVVYVYTDSNGEHWKSGSNAVILRLEQGVTYVGIVKRFLSSTFLMYNFL
ncbi:hypothetical protein KUTeg_000918 [Tegillarca granosa]|uniref:C1q domain-containing protein n=1 Tax=Tegillarca granosa TaxID=220873 RepID=A0ABQ9FWC3_TEGGR|nr:hypothetical protein KUTeg_000918 [Tegillarca granosa]